MFRNLSLTLFVSVCLSGCSQGALLSDGGYAPEGNWEGQWRLINLWAMWCKPCREEIPELNQFYALQGKNDVAVVGWNFDGLTGERLREDAEKLNISFPVLAEWPENWPEEWQMKTAQGLPATAIISPEGKLVKILLGPQTLTGLHNIMNELSAQYSVKQK